jgi:hypothetical protein
MSLPDDESAHPSGRYRQKDGTPLDPNEGLHPEMAEADLMPAAAAGIPSSPEALIAMQSRGGDDDAADPDRQPLSEKVKKVLALIEELETSSLEDQLIALALVRQLEQHHEQVMEGLLKDEGACHQQIMLWATDAERLMHCRMLLESVDLE